LYIELRICNFTVTTGALQVEQMQHTEHLRGIFGGQYGCVMNMIYQPQKDDTRSDGTIMRDWLWNWSYINTGPFVVPFIVLET
jgi:hypothetical protein